MLEFVQFLSSSGLLTTTLIIGVITIVLSIIGKVSENIEIPNQRRLVLGIFGLILVISATVGVFLEGGVSVVINPQALSSFATILGVVLIPVGLAAMSYFAVNSYRRQAEQKKKAVEKLRTEEAKLLDTIQSNVSASVGEQGIQIAVAQDKIVSRELHPQAMELIRNYCAEFATSLILQAKTLAFRRKDEVVLSNHVEEAKSLITKEQKQSWLKELVIIVGSALFGAFIQGFITELSSGNALLIATYTFLGFLGMFAVFWGLRQSW